MIKITNCFRHLNTWCKAVVHLLLFAVILQATTIAGTPTTSPPIINKAFTPDVVGPGSVSTITITITITNHNSVPVTALAFTDTLPVAPGPMILATPANASTNCDLAASGI